MAATTIIIFLILLLFFVDLFSRKFTAWFFAHSSKTISTELCVVRETQMFSSSVVTSVIFLPFYFLGYRSISVQFQEGFWVRSAFLAGIYFLSSCIGSWVSSRPKRQNLKIELWRSLSFLFFIFLTFLFLNGLTLFYGRHWLSALVDELINPTRRLP